LRIHLTHDDVTIRKSAVFIIGDIIATSRKYYSNILKNRILQTINSSLSLYELDAIKEISNIIKNYLSLGNTKEIDLFLNIFSINEICKFFLNDDSEIRENILHALEHLLNKGYIQQLVDSGIFNAPIDIKDNLFLKKLQNHTWKYTRFQLELNNLEGRIRKKRSYY